MAVTLPPLSLATGPAVSGGPTSGGVTGEFHVTRAGGDPWADRLGVALPLIAAGLALWVIARR